MDNFEFLVAKINALYSEVANLSSIVGELSSSGGQTDLTDITSRLTTLEGEMEDLSSTVETHETTLGSHTQSINNHTASISQLTPTVSAHTKKLNALHSFNYIINPDFNVCQNNSTTFQTTGTEIAFVDNWLMGTTTTGLVSYTYGTNIFTLCKNGYIKQEILPEALRAMVGKKIVVTACVSGTVPSGMQLGLTYKTVSLPNGTTKKVNINGTGTNKTYSSSYTVTDKTTYVAVKIVNSGTNSGDVKVNWIKCEIADEYTSYITPLATLEKLRCTFTGQ